MPVVSTGIISKAKLTGTVDMKEKTENKVWNFKIPTDFSVYWTKKNYVNFFLKFKLQNSIFKQLNWKALKCCQKLYQVVVCPCLGLYYVWNCEKVQNFSLPRWALQGLWLSLSRHQTNTCTNLFSVSIICHRFIQHRRETPQTIKSA